MITNGRHRRPSSGPVLTWMERVASTGWQRLIAPLMTPIMGLVVALVPPLCSAGILLYFGKRDFVWNAILLFLTNASASILATSAMWYDSPIAGVVYTRNSHKLLFLNVNSR